MAIQRERGHKELIYFRNASDLGARKCHIVTVEVADADGCGGWSVAQERLGTVGIGTRDHEHRADIRALEHCFTICACHFGDEGQRTLGTGRLVTVCATRKQQNIASCGLCDNCRCLVDACPLGNGIEREECGGNAEAGRRFCDLIHVHIRAGLLFLCEEFYQLGLRCVGRAGTVPLVEEGGVRLEIAFNIGFVVVFFQHFIAVEICRLVVKAVCILLVKLDVQCIGRAPSVHIQRLALVVGICILGYDGHVVKTGLQIVGCRGCGGLCRRKCACGGISAGTQANLKAFLVLYGHRGGRVCTVEGDAIVFALGHKFFIRFWGIGDRSALFCRRCGDIGDGERRAVDHKRGLAHKLHRGELCRGCKDQLAAADQRFHDRGSADRDRAAL